MKISLTKNEVTLLKVILQGEVETRYEDVEINPNEYTYSNYFMVKGLLKKVKDQETKDFYKKVTKKINSRKVE